MSNGNVQKIRKWAISLLFIVVASPLQEVKGETYSLDNFNSPESYFLVATDTAGLLGFVGHRHVVMADNWQVELELDTQDISGSSITVTAQTNSLILDSERSYQLAGIEKAVPPEDDRLATMDRIRGPNVLNILQNETIRFHSEEVEVINSGEGNEVVTLAVVGGLQLRSDMLPPKPIEVEVKMERHPDRLLFDGSIEVRQSEFGIKPFTLAGLMRVRDQIRIMWHVEVELGDIF